MFWVDWLIIGLVIVGMVQGFWRGLIAQVFGIASLILATIITLWAFPFVGDWFEEHFLLPVSFARPVALAVLFFSLSFVLQIIGSLLHKLLAPVLEANIFNRLGGVAIGGSRQLVFISFLLVLLITLPTPPRVKTAIEEARLAKPLIHLALGLERVVSQWIKDDSLKSLGYQIVGTDSTTTESLNFTIENPSIDESGEREMLLILNANRLKEKQLPLEANDQLREVARAHARDMLVRGYFSHLSPPPESKDVLDRVQAANIQVLSVGENLAVAPTVELAHLGLMRSEGHRKNILDSNFNTVGIAVLDAGSYGKMIVQVFAKQL